MKMKRENGITLIALVITIIVLLILAGVSISLTLGENGILTQATNAVEKHREATIEEELAIAWASCEIDYLSNRSEVSKKDFFESDNGLKKYLNGLGEVKSFTYNENGTSMIVLKNEDGTDKYLGIEPNGEIREIKIIEFTIDGKTYYAEEGMTWIDWANSSFNTDYVFMEYWWNWPKAAFLVKKDTIKYDSEWENRTPVIYEGIGPVIPSYADARYFMSVGNSTWQNCSKINEGDAFTSKYWFDGGELMPI